MRMKTTKLFKVFTLAIATSLMALALTACGQKELSPSEARDKLREQEMAKVIPISEAFSEEGIWFYYEYADRDKTITKDDYVRGGILYFDGKGNATYYNFNNVDYPTFADLNDLSDKEIIKMAEELATESVSNSQDNKISELDEKIEEIKGYIEELEAVSVTDDEMEGYNEEKAYLQSEYDELIKEKDELLSQTTTTPIPTAFKLSVETDGTGNNTQSETLHIGDKSFSFDTAISNQVIFDSTYSGMVMMDKSWFDPCLVRKVEEGHPGFRLDTPDTKGIEVD